MADEHQRVETRASISGTGMKTDPERIRDLQHDAERMERTWKDTPEEDFLEVLGRTDAKGELVGEASTTVQKGKRSEAHLRTPDPRVQALHARFGSVPAPPPVLPPDSQQAPLGDSLRGPKSTTSPTPKERVTQKNNSSAPQVTPLTDAPREDTQMLRFLAEAEDALGQAPNLTPRRKKKGETNQKLRKKNDNEAMSSSVPRAADVKKKLPLEKRSRVLRSSAEAKNIPDSSARKSRKPNDVDNTKRSVRDAERKTPRKTGTSGKVRAGPAAIPLPEMAPTSEPSASQSPRKQDRIRTRQKNVRPLDDNPKGRK
ncbi:MAG: hypothetical protein GY822_31300 [Deltaproteobacteria bacterium]|nr:hypothetical protein [Deltaproteobacteria bacterium]